MKKLNRLKFTSQSRIIIIAAVGLGVVVLGGLGRLGFINGPVSVAFSPITRGLHNFGGAVTKELGLLGSVRSLSGENAKLRKENSDLRSALASASAASIELAAIKKELGLRELAGKRLVPADVISTQPDSYRTFITINRGTSDGLAVGMAVLSDGTLVGTVSEVGSLTSKVLVVTDPTFKVVGQVLADGNAASGTVHGSIGGGLLMDKIPQDQKISVGDTVITSGLGGGIVKGYSLGTVQSVTKADNGVFQSAQLSTPIRADNLQTVFVVIN